VESAFEMSLIAQCAPTLAGVKPGSLFGFTAGMDENITAVLLYWNRQLSGKGLRFYLLKENNSRQLILVYRPKPVERILEDKSVSAFLEACGYRGCIKPEEYIEVLSRRMNGAPSFPHEIGVFLGYPLHDVTGFIENAGKNSRCCGYWKVYDEQDEAERSFRRFKKCTCIYRRLFESGKTVLQLTVAA
jgi:hypothetical protein